MVLEWLGIGSEKISKDLSDIFMLPFGLVPLQKHWLKCLPVSFVRMDWFVNRQVVALFQDARGTAKIFHGAGRHGIVTALPEHEVEERWHHIRKTFLDAKERRGQNRPDAPDAHLQRFEVFYCCLVYATVVYNSYNWAGSLIPCFAASSGCARLLKYLFFFGGGPHEFRIGEPSWIGCSSFHLWPLKLCIESYIF